MFPQHPIRDRSVFFVKFKEFVGHLAAYHEKFPMKTIVQHCEDAVHTLEQANFIVTSATVIAPSIRNGHAEIPVRDRSGQCA